MNTPQQTIDLHQADSGKALAESPYSLILGDCLEVMETLADKSVDAIITDLPYGTTACKWDSVIPFDPLWNQLRRVLKQNGVFVTTASQPFTTALISSNLAEFKYCWTWNKGKAGNFAIAKTQPLRVTEDILVFSRDRHTYNPQMTLAKKENMRPRNKGYKQAQNGTTQGIASGIFVCSESHREDLRHPTNLLNFKSTEGECNNVNRVHPTQKPVSLMQYLVRTYTNTGDVVLDPCMGSGTTCLAAKMEGRRYIGIEKDPEYFCIASKRLQG